MPIYEVCIIKTPTENETKDGAIEEIIVNPTTVSAKDPQAASVLVAVQSKVEMTPRIKVLVRPFSV